MHFWGYLQWCITQLLFRLFTASPALPLRGSTGAFRYNPAALGQQCMARQHWWQAALQLGGSSKSTEMVFSPIATKAKTCA
jgi:hypothetical protein